MAIDEQVMARFQTRVRQIILLVKHLEEENAKLKDLLTEQEVSIKSLQEKLKSQEKSYNLLLIAKMLEVAEGDRKIARNKVSRLIREVEKCIALLGGTIN